MLNKKNLRLLLTLIMAAAMILNMTVMAFATEAVDGPTMSDNKIGGTKETDYTLYMSNGEAFVNVGDESVSAFLTIDKRFFEIEDITMTLEIRQYNSSGYTVAGTAVYDYEQLQVLAEKADSEDETTYTFKSLEIPVEEGKSFNEGWAEYCVVKFNRPSWTDDEGKATYRWTYTGDAAILGEGVEAPSPIVWLYNLDENSHRGALIRSILEELNIPAGTVNSANLNQNIGYLVGWEGYEAVEDPYSSESYDVEYILMGNLTEVQLDDFINGMQENNIRVNLKSIPTAWTASKTFAELFDIMAEEDEVLKAAISLDEMIYDAEALDEETYGNSPYWEEFKQKLADAVTALSTDAEESGEGADLYLNAREELLEAYLKVTGKQIMEGELELILEEQADGTYEVSAKLNGEASDATFDYSWKPSGSTEDSITMAADQLYKVSLEIKGNGNYYGELTAKLNVPGAPAFTVEAADTTLTVKLNAYENVLNTPEVSSYVAQLYLNGELIETKEAAAVDELVFGDLTAETEYVVKVYAQNVVGRSDIVEQTVATVAAELDDDLDDDQDSDQDTDLDDEQDGDTDNDLDDDADVDADSDENQNTDADADVNTDADTEESYSESKFEEASDEAEETEAVAKTGDDSNLMAWAVLMILTGAITGTAIRRKNYNL